MPLNVHWKARLAFVGLVGAAGLGGWYFLSSGHHLSYEIDTHETVSGLTEGAPVEMHGVEIGTVRRIRLAGPQTVHMVLSINGDAPITRATTAVLTARGLAARGFMGYVYIALENSGTDGRPLAVDTSYSLPVIQMAPPEIDTVDTTAVAAIQDVRTLSQLLRTLLDPAMVTSLKQSANDAGHLLALLMANEGRLQSLLTNIEQDTQQIGQLLDEKTVTSLKQSANGLQNVVSTLAAKSETLSALLGNAEQDSRDLKPLLNASGFVVRQFRSEVLPQLHQAVSDLDHLTHAVRPLATRAARDPSNLLRGTEIPPGPGER